MAAASEGMHGFVPALTSFVGRDDEGTRVAALLSEYRLVTVTVSTVRSHLDRIRDKTGRRRRADLTRLALQAGLI